MKSSLITVRVSAKLKQRIAASSRNSGKSTQRWIVEVLKRAAGAEELPEAMWERHWEWLRRHGRKATDQSVDRLIRESRNR